MQRPEVGLTLIELMVVVAIVGVLAALAVFTYTKYTKKARTSEIYAVMGEFKIKENQFQVENSTFVGGADETAYFPKPLSEDKPTSTAGPPATWTNLKLNIGKTELWCGYVPISGPANDGTNIGAKATAFGFVTPVQDWYYVLAECDFTDTTYMMRFDIDKIANQKQ
jgi:type IV pilus assembly protein PilE